jgi:hypothetical protein
MKQGQRRKYCPIPRKMIYSAKRPLRQYQQLITISNIYQKHQKHTPEALKDTPYDSVMFHSMSPFYFSILCLCFISLFPSSVSL